MQDLIFFSLPDHPIGFEVNCSNELTEWQVLMFLQFVENRENIVKSVCCAKFDNHSNIQSEIWMNWDLVMWNSSSYRIYPTMANIQNCWNNIYSTGRCSTTFSCRTANILDVRHNTKNKSGLCISTTNKSSICGRCNFFTSFMGDSGYCWFTIWNILA